MSQRKRPWFIFDIDDVLCNCSDTVRNMYNKEHGTNIGPPTSYNTIAAWPEIGEQGDAWFFHHYTNGKTMGSLPVIDGALAMAKEIEKKFRIAYCTHRPEKIRKETCEWIRSHGFPDGEIYFNSGSKVSFRKNNKGPIVFLDDNAEYLNQIAVSTNEPTLVLCVTMPHNEQMKLPENAIRITDYTNIPIIAEKWRENLLGK